MSRAPVDELIRIAADENDRLFAAVGKVGYALLFTTSEGVVADVRGEPARIQQFQRWGIWQGGVWAESVEGTNGIGTCIAEKAPVTVHCSQHFRVRHATLSCCGAPVFDPNQNLVAVVDALSLRAGFSDHSHALAFALTVEAARSIEERLFRHVHRRAWILSYIPPTRSQPILLAVENDERVLGADRHARAVLDIDDQQLAAGLSLWRFFYRLPSLFASKSGAHGFVKLTSARGPGALACGLHPTAATARRSARLASSYSGSERRPRPDRARASDPRAGGPRSVEQADRTDLGHLAGDREDAPGSRLRQARRRASRAGHRAREGPRAPKTSLKSNRLRIPQSRSRSASGAGRTSSI